MSRTITITLPERLAEHLEILAGIEQQTLEETVLAQLDYVALPTDDDVSRFFKGAGEYN